MSFAECHYAECHYAQCHLLNVIMLSAIVIILSAIIPSVIIPCVIMLSVIMLSVIMLSVVSPFYRALILKNVFFNVFRQGQHQNSNLQTDYNKKTTFSSIKIVALIGIYIDKVFFIKKSEIMTMVSAHGAM